MPCARKAATARAGTRLGPREPAAATSSKAGPAAQSGAQATPPRSRRTAPRAGLARPPRFRRPPGRDRRPRPRPRPPGPASRSRSSKRTPGPPDPRPQNSGAPPPSQRGRGGTGRDCGAEAAPRLQQAGPDRAWATEGAGPPSAPAWRVPPSRASEAYPSVLSRTASSRGPLFPGRSPPDSAPRSLRFSSSSGSGAPDHSDSLTAALRSATELRAPPSRRPDQQMGGAAPPAGFHWATFSMGGARPPGARWGRLPPALLPLRRSGRDLSEGLVFSVPAGACLCVHPTARSRCPRWFRWTQGRPPPSS